MRPELDTKNPPGQQTYTSPEHQQLSDYIRSINRREALDNVASENMLSFEVWWKEFSLRYSLDDVDSLATDFEACWIAARRGTK